MKPHFPWIIRMHTPIMWFYLQQSWKMPKVSAKHVSLWKKQVFFRTLLDEFLCLLKIEYWILSNVARKLEMVALYFWFLNGRLSWFINAKNFKIKNWEHICRRTVGSWGSVCYVCLISGGYDKFPSFYQYGSGEVLSRSIRMS